MFSLPVEIKLHKLCVSFETQHSIKFLHLVKHCLPLLYPIVCLCVFGESSNLACTFLKKNESTC